MVAFSPAQYATQIRPSSASARDLRTHIGDLPGMWSLDSTWVAKATQIDGRMCLSNPPVPWTRACGGSPIGTQVSYLQVNQPCDVNTFAKTMFQVVRYAWAQEQLARLMASKPTVSRASATSASANAWADWCIKVMRLVSMARWSTNIREDYLRPLNEGLEAARVSQDILSFLPAQPSKDDPRDRLAVNDGHTMLFAMPRVFRPMPGSPFGIPIRADHFDPLWINSSMVYAAPVEPWSYAAVWPIEHLRHTGSALPIPQGPGTVGSSRVRDALVTWFERTLSGTGGTALWWPGRNVNASTLGWVGCGLQPGACPRRFVNRRHWWGSAEAQIRMCEAWATDVISTSVGQAVAGGIENFLVRYRALPAAYRVLTTEQIDVIRSQITAARIDEMKQSIGVAWGAIVMIAGAIAAPVGAVLGAAIALVWAVLEILQAAGAMAYGGGDMDAAMLPPVVLRSIPDRGGCNFDPRGVRAGTAASMAEAVQSAAADDLPVSVWFERSARAEAEAEGRNLDLPLLIPRDSGGGGGGGGGRDITTPATPAWLPWAAGAVLVVGGALVIKKLRE